MLGVGPAFAASLHFISASASFASASSPNLNVNFKEASLGDTVTINYTASADATATYACINGGNNHPQAANKATVNGPVSSSGAFSSGKNGSITASLTLTPPSAGSFSCPNGQRLVLADVSYTNVAITDTTNNVSRSIAGTFSKTLFNFWTGRTVPERPRSAAAAALPSVQRQGRPTTGGARAVAGRTEGRLAPEGPGSA
ncbi:hypothetical protein [Kitasatospora sp. KL5]|uniref:hypothetical protein n=1 Tax=Kitasatospora sp. KL5 TaxID=3425125 RepID=UPI003D6DFEBB